MSTVKAKQKKKVRKNIQTGVAHIQATFNNTIITITDVAGNTIATSSAGMVGFKGSRKSTPFAATTCAEDVAKKAMEHGVRQIGVLVKGPGAGREPVGCGPRALLRSARGSRGPFFSARGSRGPFFSAR